MRALPWVASEGGGGAVEKESECGNYEPDGVCDPNLGHAYLSWEPTTACFYIIGWFITYCHICDFNI
jgi:hypothetical protein